MRAKYSSTSNYSDTSLNMKYLEQYRPRYTASKLSADVKKIKVGNRYHRRPDLLAFDLYGSSRFWWVFTHYNRDLLKDPINDFVSGITITIPRKQSDVRI